MVCWKKEGYSLRAGIMIWNFELLVRNRKQESLLAGGPSMRPLDLYRSAQQHSGKIPLKLEVEENRFDLCVVNQLDYVICNSVLGELYE